MIDGPFHWLPAAAPWLALAVLTAVVALLLAADDGESEDDDLL